jgi:anti-sigma regulatory factor (Ser/Thr protein kinase)
MLRRGLSEFLGGCDLSDDDRYDVLLAVCEAVSNGIEHAQHPREPCVDVTAEIGPAAVTVVVRDHGQWREDDPAEGRGRGLGMMWILANTTVAAGPQGTTVTIRSSPRHGQSPVASRGEHGLAGGSPFPSSAVGGG